MSGIITKSLRRHIMDTNIILAIPGTWETQEALIQAITDTDMGYECIQNVIQNDALESSAYFEQFQASEDFTHMFKHYSMGKFSPDALEDIANHKSVVYITCPAGSLTQASSAMNIAYTLLLAGGLGVKVESSGIVHTKEIWLNFDLKSIASMMEAYVVMIDDGKQLMSCGMHTFGKPEVAIQNDSIDGKTVADSFLRYVLEKDPQLTQDQLFNAKEDDPTFSLHKLYSSTFYEDEDVYFNPYDIWELREAQSK